MPPHRTPPWLTSQAAEAMRRAAGLALARRLDAAEEARRVAWALHPALPARMISEAVEAVLEAGEGGV
ncbi:hypothetical protein KTR66_15120 [Roseococcus sp. SDR]|uniref:hypothetical protein n=1 Tax=Roseococcus sp. SDR TaxID=2835532 RepID=UPI001BD1731A|nr:hypothetical protein [Roseococcus sp. SDR]MBS7791333.1 hypothetical protein [Roseococcus sp. SDR]MBV1846647.1 hypothetical protein [Roseococcus sp. SDR]